MAMDAELKSKWVSALRSGDYKQGEGLLHDPDKDNFCCLGVLCKIIGAEFSDISEEDDDPELGWKNHAYVPHLNGRVLGEDEELKKSFAKEIGIPDQFELIKLNDGHADTGIRQHSFIEIADYIEQNL